MLEVPKADLELPLPVMLWALAANDRQGFRLQQSPDRVDHVDTDRDVPDRHCQVEGSSRNTGARTVVMPRWLRCAIAPPPLIGRSEASTGR